MAELETPEQHWRALLDGTHPNLQHSSKFRFVPSDPRCKLCAVPFGGFGGAVFRRRGYGPWEKNPRICGKCFGSVEKLAKGCPTTGPENEVSGAEVEISMLFADVRGSSKLARQMPPTEFTHLMSRFYRVSRNVLVEHDAIIEKFVGDEVVGLFVPFMTGPEHALRAVDGALELLRATGHGDPDGPWVPLGAGVHTGTAFVGLVGSGNSADFTALGDPVNIAAHLASQAAIGEILVTHDTADAAGLLHDGLERRHVSLKGHPLDTLVLTPQAQAGAPSDA